MRILIYKRTHKGDPDTRGIFGVQDCMGRIRNWNYDAVIGIGGNAPLKGQTDIRHKINWIGLGPKKMKTPLRGDVVVFEHFELYEDTGINIKDSYPYLFDHMYGSRKRFDMSDTLPEDVLREVVAILDSVKNSLQSEEYDIIDINEIIDSSTHKTSECRGHLCGKKVEVTIDEK